MAIIKCDDELPPGTDDSVTPGDSTTPEEYVEQDSVTLGKKLLAVESGFFLSDTISPPVLFNENLLATRPQDIEDSFRADSNRYWTLDENGNMKYMNTNLYGYNDNVNAISPPPPFQLIGHTTTETDLTSSLGFQTKQAECTIWANNNCIPNTALWGAFIDGDGVGGTIVMDDQNNIFSRPSPLIPPTGNTFTDHAFEMKTPFSKKELEMFANISGDVKVADVESDYDFYSKAYEEGIASTTVPENALPHLYTEVQRGDSDVANTDKLPQGYFRQWMDEVLSDPDKMSEIANRYENVAILDSIINETNDTTSAFETLMSYANRENLFPMNINIEIGTEDDTSDLILKAEEVGMVDDIVRLLMGNGDITDVV